MNKILIALVLVVGLSGNAYADEQSKSASKPTDLCKFALNILFSVRVLLDFVT